MEPKEIRELLPKVPSESPSLQLISSPATTSEISLYKDKPPIPQEISNEITRLRNCFDVNEGFVVNLIDRLTANKFTKQRFHDAVSHLIDTCHYPKPNVADIISFDRKVKTYTYSEMIAMCNQYRTSENFEQVDLGGPVKRWIEK